MIEGSTPKAKEVMAHLTYTELSCSHVINKEKGKTYSEYSYPETWVVVGLQELKQQLLNDVPAALENSHLVHHSTDLTLDSAGLIALPF